MAIQAAASRLILDPAVINKTFQSLSMREDAVKKIVQTVGGQSPEDLIRQVDSMQPALASGVKSGTQAAPPAEDGALPTRPAQDQARRDTGPDGGYSQPAVGAQSTEGSQKAVEQVVSQQVGQQVAAAATAAHNANPTATPAEAGTASPAAATVTQAPRSAQTQQQLDKQEAEAFAEGACSSVAHGSPRAMVSHAVRAGLVDESQAEAMISDITRRASEMGGTPGGQAGIDTMAQLAGPVVAHSMVERIVGGGLTGGLVGGGLGAGGGALLGQMLIPIPGVGALVGGVVGGLLGAKAGATVGSLGAAATAPPGSVPNPILNGGVPGMNNNAIMAAMGSFMTRTGGGIPGLGAFGGNTGSRNIMGGLFQGAGGYINQMTSVMRQDAIDSNDREALRIVNSNMPIEAKIAMYMARVNERSALELEKKMAEAEASRQREKDEENWGKMVESVGAVPVVGQAISSSLTLAKGASEIGRVRPKSSTALQAELQYMLQVYTQQMGMWSNVLHNMKTVGDTINSNLRG